MACRKLMQHNLHVLEHYLSDLGFDFQERTVWWLSPDQTKSVRRRLNNSHKDMAKNLFLFNLKYQLNRGQMPNGEEFPSDIDKKKFSDIIHKSEVHHIVPLCLLPVDAAPFATGKDPQEEFGNLFAWWKVNAHQPSNFAIVDRKLHSLVHYYLELQYNLNGDRHFPPVHPMTVKIPYRPDSKIWLPETAAPRPVPQLVRSVEALTAT